MQNYNDQPIVSNLAPRSGTDGGTRRPRVLCVDDEPYVLEGLKDTLRRSFEVHVASDPHDGLDQLRRDPEGFAVVISDMRMPRMSGADFLRQARMIAPYTVRLLLTGHADLESAIKAVNGARLFRYLTKPCESGELLRACVAALGHHRLQTAERELLEQTLRGSVDALAEVLALTNPAVFGRAGRIKALAGKLARAIEMPNGWEVEVAAMLAQIGAVTLPQATAEKLYAGTMLNDAETEMVARVPAVTRGLLSKIPRLEGVIEILDSYRTALPHADEGAARDAPIGALVLRVVVDYDALEVDGASEDAALGVMQNRGIYDLRVMDAFTRIVGAVGGIASVREVLLRELRVGMTLEGDLRNTRDGLLVARGQAVTEQLLERLANLPSGTVREPIRISEPTH